MAERDDRRSTGPRDLLRYTRTTAIVGDILKIRAHDVGLGDMALVEIPGGEQSLAQAIQFEGDEVSLQVFGGGEGLSTQATVRFLGHPTQVTYSPNILGRVFAATGSRWTEALTCRGFPQGPRSAIHLRSCARSSASARVRSRMSSTSFTNGSMSIGRQHGCEQQSFSDAR